MAYPLITVRSTDDAFLTRADLIGFSAIRLKKDDSITRGKNGRKIWSLFAPGWLAQWSAYTATGAEVGKLNTTATISQYAKYGFGYEGVDVVFPNGYNEIFKGLEANYQVRLNSAVDRIEYSRTAVKIGVKGKDLQRFDAVIVTVPLGVLKQKLISFAPALPLEKQAAITRMGMGTLDKLYLRFEEPFWDDKSN